MNNKYFKFHQDCVEINNRGDQSHLTFVSSRYYICSIAQFFLNNQFIAILLYINMF